MHNAADEYLSHDLNQRTMHLFFDLLMRRGISRTQPPNGLTMNNENLNQIRGAAGA